MDQRLFLFLDFVKSRASTTTAYYVVDINELDNHSANVSATEAVGKYLPNDFGFYDMLGASVKITGTLTVDGLLYYIVIILT